MPSILKISPCLWFDDQAEAAARFYAGIFPDSRILGITHYGDAGREVHGRPSGSVMTVEFELCGQPFTALNGGPVFRFNEAISFQVSCDGQEEIDHYWRRLGEGGDPQSQQCGWLKDCYGVSWQVVPAVLRQMLLDPEKGSTEKVMTALLQMRKLEIAALQQAYAG